MAGKTILNQELIKRITDNITKGVSIESVAALSGISPRVYYQWRKQGEQDIEDGVESVHAEFAESILAAGAEVEQLLLDHDLPPKN